MARSRSSWVCRECGHCEARWQGRCPQCEAWGSFDETDPALAAARSQAARPTGALGDGVPRPIAASAAATVERVATGLRELDRVLGGGLVPGSLVLLGGEPGIGKSTLLLQALDGLARGAARGRPVLYVSAEESIAQTSLRARRIGVGAENLLVISESSIEAVLDTVAKLAPAAVAVDSVQTVFSTTTESLPGSVTQVRECAGRLLSYAKGAGVPIVLVGHVTKDGTLAGPKTLEHLVDAVLHFEGDGMHALRLLRAAKNRFGSTSELGVFDMRGEGLVQVENPSAQFLAERPIGAPGSAVVVSAEASRPLCVEVQALVGSERTPAPRRTTVGLDPLRVAMLLAVLERHMGGAIAGRDVFVNVAGGVRLSEPAADLAVVAALASSLAGRALAGDIVVFGEVGLAGEVRAVQAVETRVAEANKLGFRRCVLPAGARSRGVDERSSQPSSLERVGVRTVREALDALLPAEKQPARNGRTAELPTDRRP